MKTCQECALSVAKSPMELYIVRKGSSKINDLNAQFDSWLRAETGRKPTRVKANGSESHPIHKDSSRRFEGKQLSIAKLVSIGVPEDQQGKAFKERARNELKDNYNTEESIASIKGVTSHIPMLWKMDIYTIGFFKSTYPCM